MIRFIIIRKSGKEFLLHTCDDPWGTERMLKVPFHLKRFIAHPWDDLFHILKKRGYNMTRVSREGLEKSVF